MAKTIIRTLISINDPTYFCNKSWTLSYNMITQSWVSFHSYIPNWYIAENNFFYSGINDCNDDIDFIVAVVDASIDCTLEGIVAIVELTTTTTTTINPECIIEVTCYITESTTSTTTTLFQCGQSNSFSGGLVFPSTENIYLGVDTGYVVLDFNAFTLPDKFIVTFDGIEVINTGYRGDNSIQGIQDALTNNLVNIRFLPDETIVGIGLGSTYFYKNSAITTATVEVYAPLDGTAWGYTLSCPSPTLSTTTSTTTVIPECVIQAICIEVECERPIELIQVPFIVTWYTPTEGYHVITGGTSEEVCDSFELFKSISYETGSVIGNWEGELNSLTIGETVWEGYDEINCTVVQDGNYWVNLSLPSIPGFEDVHDLSCVYIVTIVSGIITAISDPCCVTTTTTSSSTTTTTTSYSTTSTTTTIVPVTTTTSTTILSCDLLFNLVYNNTTTTTTTMNVETVFIYIPNL